MSTRGRGMPPRGQSPENRADSSTRRNSRGIGLVKCVLCFINFVTMLCGIGLFGVGIWTYFFKNYMDKFITSYMYGVSDIILIAAGAVIIVVSFMGCCGSKNEVKWMLVLYFLILLVLFVLLVAAGAMALLFKSQLSESVYVNMQKSIPLYGTQSTVTNSWDNMQSGLQCCGLKEGSNDSYTVWNRINEYFKDKAKIVPESCCKKTDEASIKQCNEEPKKFAYDKDCFHEVELFAKENALILGALGFAVALVLIFGMILTCLLISMIG